MLETKAVAPSNERTSGEPTSDDIDVTFDGLEAEASASDDEITIRCIGEQNEMLMAAALEAAKACPPEWDPDDEITLDAPAPVSTPRSPPVATDAACRGSLSRRSS